MNDKKKKRAEYTYEEIQPNDRFTMSDTMIEVLVKDGFG
jgi:hypothetical protein